MVALCPHFCHHRQPLWQPPTRLALRSVLLPRELPGPRCRPITTVMAALQPVAQCAVSACIFDMDGLLLDTETSYTVAQQQILQRFGKQFTWDLKAKMMGRKALDAAQLLVTELQLEGQITAQDFLTEREQILDAMFAAAPLLPGVDRLIRHLRLHSVPIAVATSSHKRHFDLKTTLHRELFTLFDCIITGDQVTNSKPAPDIFLLALKQLQERGAGGAGGLPLAPQHCLVFEDAPTGVDAGLAAGMKVIMVPDPNLDPALTGKATLQLKSLEDFDPQAWGLPPFPS